MDTVPSTWCVLNVDGTVTHQPGEPTHVAIRRALAGYAPQRIDLDDAVNQRIAAWRAEVTGQDAVANYPGRALLAGHLAGPTALLGPIVLAGIDGEGLPEDILEKLTGYDQRARARAVSE